MQLAPEVNDAISKVAREFGQSAEFEKQFRTYFENLVISNIGKHDLDDLIEAVALDKEDDEDGA